MSTCSALIHMMDNFNRTYLFLSSLIMLSKLWSCPFFFYACKIVWIKNTLNKTHLVSEDDSCLSAKYFFLIIIFKVISAWSTFLRPFNVFQTLFYFKILAFPKQETNPGPVLLSQLCFVSCFFSRCRVILLSSVILFFLSDTFISCKICCEWALVFVNDLTYIHLQTTTFVLH